MFHVHPYYLSVNRHDHHAAISWLNSICCLQLSKQALKVNRWSRYILVHIQVQVYRFHLRQAGSMMIFCLWNRHVWLWSLRLWHFDTLRYSSQNCLTGLVVVNLKLFFPNLAPKDHDAAAEDAALRAGTLDAAKPSACPFRGLHPASAVIVCPFASGPAWYTHRRLGLWKERHWFEQVRPQKKMASVRRACRGITVVNWIHRSGLQWHCNLG